MMSEQSQLVTMTMTGAEGDSNVQEVEDTSGGAGCRRRCPRVLLVFLAAYLALLVVFLTLAVVLRKGPPRPHVVLVLVDDLGWADVQWADPDMRTPVLAGLLASGVLLNRSYVHPLDGPSRASLLTGLWCWTLPSDSPRPPHRSVVLDPAL